MEFVDGANLKTIADVAEEARARTFPIPAAAYIAHEICKGLSYAHELTDRERRAARHRASRHVAAERARHEAR